MVNVLKSRNNRFGTHLDYDETLCAISGSRCHVGTSTVGASTLSKYQVFGLDTIEHGEIERSMTDYQIGNP